LDDRGRDGGTNFILIIKGQEYDDYKGDELR